MSFAASAFAIHAEIPSETTAMVATGTTQITLGGEIRTRGWWESNIAGGKPVDSPNGAWYDERVRLSLDAQVSPNVEGFVQLESGNANNPAGVGVTQSDYVFWGNFEQQVARDEHPSGMDPLQEHKPSRICLWHEDRSYAACTWREAVL